MARWCSCTHTHTHTASNTCTGNVFIVEMHHQRVEQAKPDDNVGLVLIKKTCFVLDMSWCIRRTPPWHRQRNSMHRSRSLTFPTRSRHFTPQLVSCDVDVQLAVSQRDWRQENGGFPLAEVQRDGTVQLPASAAACLRQLQELRGFFPRSFHGRQWICYVGQGDMLREDGRCRWCWKEERVSSCFCLHLGDGGYN